MTLVKYIFAGVYACRGSLPAGEAEAAAAGLMVCCKDLLCFHSSLLLQYLANRV